jgi:hypothetical protein
LEIQRAQVGHGIPFVRERVLELGHGSKNTTLRGIESVASMLGFKLRDVDLCLDQAVVQISAAAAAVNQSSPTSSQGPILH